MTKVTNQHFSLNLTVEIFDNLLFVNPKVYTTVLYYIVYKTIQLETLLPPVGGIKCTKFKMLELFSADYTNHEYITKIFEYN